MSNDIAMMFGISKCQTVSVVRGKLRQGHPMELDEQTNIPAMEDEPYKCLGMMQTNRVEHKEIKQTLEKKFRDRLRSIVKTKLYSKNLIKAINCYAMPILGYSFGVIKWTDTDLESINRIVRTTLTKSRMHHPRASMERVTLPREQGGRGVVDAADACNKQILGLRQYFLTKRSPLYENIVKADLNYTPLNLSSRERYEGVSVRNIQEKNRAWAAKELHGRYHRDLHRNHIDKQASVEWLINGSLMPETEGFVIAIQDQVVNTRSYSKYILKQQVPTDKCRRCNLHQETIEHILSGCSNMAGNKYTDRHNKAAKVVYLELAKKHAINLEDLKPYYNYNPPPVIENNNIKILWDKAIITDVEVRHNRPDITIINKKEKKAYLVDISVPNTNNMEAKAAEKIEKYLELKREVKEMYNMEQVEIIPIIISSTGVVPKNLKENLSRLGIPPNTYRQIQKAVVLDAAHIVRFFLEL